MFWLGLGPKTTRLGLGKHHVLAWNTFLFLSPQTQLKNTQWRRVYKRWNTDLNSGHWHGSLVTCNSPPNMNIRFCQNVSGLQSLWCIQIVYMYVYLLWRASKKLCLCLVFNMSANAFKAVNTWLALETKSGHGKAKLLMLQEKKKKNPLSYNQAVMISSTLNVHNILPRRTFDWSLNIVRTCTVHKRIISTCQPSENNSTDSLSCSPLPLSLRARNT